MTIAYWPTSPSVTDRERQDEVRPEVGRAFPDAVVLDAGREHAEGREPAQADREDDEEHHPEQEVGRRVEHQRDAIADVVDGAAAFPARVRAQRESDHDRQQLAQPEQDDRRPDPLAHHLDDRRSAGHEREAEVAA